MEQPQQRSTPPSGTIVEAAEPSAVALDIPTGQKGDLGEAPQAAVGFRRRVRAVTSDSQLLSLILVYFVVFVDIMGVAVLLPVLPFLVGAQHHEDSFSSDEMFNLEAGAAMSVVLVSYNAAQLVSTIVFGPMSDKVGRKPMFLLSLVGGILGYGLQGLSIAVGSFPFFLGARVVTGLFGGTRPVAIAYIADSAPPEERAKQLGMLALSVTVAMQFGPVLGGSLGSLNLPLPCFVACGVSAVGLLVVSFYVHESEKRDLASAGAAAAASAKASLADKVTFAVNTIFSFTTGFWLMSSLTSFALLLPARFNFDPNKVGLASLGDGVMILLGNPCYLFLIKRVRVPLVGAIGSCLMAVVFICPFLDDLVPHFFLRYLAVLGSPMAVPATSAIVSAIAPPARRGAWTGMTVAAQSLGRTLAPLVLGPSFDADYHLPFAIASGVILVGLCACLFMVCRVPPIQPPQPVQKKAQDGEEAEDKGAASPRASEPDFLSEQAEALVQQLRQRQQLIRQRLETVKAGEPDPRDYPPMAPADRERVKGELGDWLVGLLEAHGYMHWAHHLDGIKLVLTNSLPPLRTGTPLERLTDLIRMMERHIAMAEQSELFDRAGDLTVL